MRLKMTGAQWVRDGDRILADMPVKEVELTTEIEFFLFDPSALYLVDDPELRRGCSQGLLPALVWGWAWDAERRQIVKHGFKFWLAAIIPKASLPEALAAAWPGVRFTPCAGDSILTPGAMFDREPADAAEKTLPPGNPPPIEMGGCAPWRTQQER